MATPDMDDSLREAELIADVVELLRRNSGIDLEKIGETCRKYRLHGWDEVMKELGE